MSPLDHCASANAHPPPAPFCSEVSHVAFGRPLQTCAVCTTAYAQGNTASQPADLAAATALTTDRQYNGSPVHDAAKNDRTETLKLLLEQGAAVDAATECGETALQVACKEGHLSCVKALLDAGADINRADLRGRTALLWAALSGHLAVVELLLLRGVKLQAWEFCHRDPLGAAACRGHLACVQALVEAGAPIVTSRHCWSALDSAARAGHTEVLHYLKEQQGVADAVHAPAATHPILAASQKGHVPCIKSLLGAGYQVDHPDPNGRTALYLAARQGHAQAVALLLSHGAKVLQGWSSYRHDPLYIAAFKGHFDCVQALAVAGAPIITRKKHSFSALNGAAQNGHAEILKYLLNQGISADAVSTPIGGTPLLIAAQRGQLLCIQTLLDAGADINRPDSYGETALHSAARKGHLSAVDLLLQHNPTVDCRTGTGETPLLAACRKGHTAVVAALLKGGADPKMTAGDDSPLRVATLEGHPKVVEQLLATGAYLFEKDLCGVEQILYEEIRKTDGATQQTKQKNLTEITRLLQLVRTVEARCHHQTCHPITEKKASSQP